MKVCPKCLLQYEDVENFCFNDGTKLDILGDSNEEQTVIIPIAPTQLVNCRSCNAPNQADAKFCKTCGFPFTAVNEPIQIPLNQPLSSQQETVMMQNVHQPGQPALSSFQPSHLLASSHSDNTAKYVLGGFGLIVILILAGFLLYPKPTDTDGDTSKKTNKKDSEKEESSSKSKPGPQSPLVGKIAYLQVNANLRDCPDRNCQSVAVHFKNAKLKILDVEEKSDGPAWYKVEVLEYGCHTLNRDWCGKQLSLDRDDTRTYPLDIDQNAKDVGWVISYSRDLGRDVVRY
jgi:hypothetical protein